MKKFFSFFAALLFAGSMMAAPYTLKFNYYDSTSGDKSAAETTLDGLFDAASMAYVDAEAAFTIDKVYLGRKYKDKVSGDSIFSNIKFGSSSAAGTLKFALKNMAVDSVIFSAAMYGDSEGGDGFSVNGTAFTLSAGNKTFENVKYVPAGDITALEIVQTKANKGRFYLTSITVYPKEGGETPATEPAAAPDAPTVPANQVKAVYSAIYNADCNFGEWGSGTAYTQETVGKKYVTTGLGYFGLEFAEHLNCAKMEKLHMDVWVAADASIRIVPIWGGAEQGIAVNLVGQQWNAVELALTAFDQVTNWTDVYQIKIDNAANLTFWLNNVYFYTTVAPAADTEAPTAVAASLVSASYFSAKISATATDNSDAVIFVVKNGETELATAPAVSGVAKEITVNGLLPNTAYNFSVIAKDEAGNAAEPVAVAATTLAAPAPATAPTYAADKVLALYTDVYTNVKFDIQDWWAMPAVSEGNLTATSKALCLEPNTTPSSCFGLAFEAVDASAYDALEMDVYATTEGSVLNTQAIGIGEAQTFNLVAGQWNHIVLDIKGNTKADLQQVGFYDCHNLTGVVFIQNVLFVDTDAPVVSAISLTQFIADKPATEVELKDLTVIYATGKNTYVIDEDGVALVMYDANKTYYDGTLTAGKVLSGQKATYTNYNNQDEIIPTNAVVATDGTAPVPVLMAAAPTAEANVNQYLRFENVAATETSGKYYIYENVQLYGASADLKPTEAGNYNVEGIFINYKGNTPELIVTAIEKAGGVTPVEGDTIDVTINAITTPGALVWTDAVASAGWWQIMGATEDYEFSLSNVSTTEVAGVYAIDDLDPDYSYITVMTATDTTDVTFVDGSVTVAVANDGTVTIVGALVGDDGNVYNFNLTYADPKAERVANVTISKGTLYDGYASACLYAVYGTADDNTDYVQLAIWVEEDFEGNFTEEDLDLQYIGSGVQDAEGSHSIFSAAITVTPGNGEGVYSITADLLCYNNTLYKVTMSIGNTEGFESVDAAVKAVKMLINGNVVIEKAGKRYNVNGAVIR